MGMERQEFIWDEERGILVPLKIGGPEQEKLMKKEGEDKKKKIKKPKYHNGGRAKKARCRWHNHRR